MITPGQIQSLAKTHQIDNFTILREYLQLVFLGHLYSDRKSKHIYFKGGTAIPLLLDLLVVQLSPKFATIKQ